MASNIISCLPTIRSLFSRVVIINGFGLWWCLLSQVVAISTPLFWVKSGGNSAESCCQPGFYSKKADQFDLGVCQGATAGTALNICVAVTILHSFGDMKGPSALLKRHEMHHRSPTGLLGMNELNSFVIVIIHTKQKRKNNFRLSAGTKVKEEGVLCLFKSDVSEKICKWIFRLEGQSPGPAACETTESVS